MDREPNSNNGEKRATRWDDLIKPEQEQSERQFVKFEELEPIFADKNALIMGHGTATSGNDHDVVDAILREGLRGFQSLDSVASEVQHKDEVAGSADLRDTAIPLSDPNSDEPVAMLDIKDQLDHWAHRDAENVILIRLPLEFLNHEMLKNQQFAPFFIQKRDKDGQMRNYLDSRLIVGNYNRETGLVEMNDQFQPELTDEFRSELNQRYEELLKEAEERMDKFEMPGRGDLKWREPEEGGNEEEDDLWNVPTDDGAWVDMLK